MEKLSIQIYTTIDQANHNCADITIFPPSVGGAEFTHRAQIPITLLSTEETYFNRIKVEVTARTGGVFVTNQDTLRGSFGGGVKKTILPGHVVCTAYIFKANVPFKGEVIIPIFKTRTDYQNSIPTGKVLYAGPLDQPDDHFDLRPYAHLQVPVEAQIVPEGCDPVGDCFTATIFGKGGNVIKRTFAASFKRREYKTYIFNAQIGSRKQGYLHLLLNGEVITTTTGHIEDDYSRLISRRSVPGGTEYTLKSEPGDSWETLFEWDYYGKDSLTARGLLFHSDNDNADTPLAEFFKKNKIV